MTDFDYDDGLSDPRADPADEWDRAYDATPHKNGETPTPAAMPKRKPRRRVLVRFDDGCSDTPRHTIGKLLVDTERGIRFRDGTLELHAEWPREGHTHIGQHRFIDSVFVDMDTDIDVLVKELGLTK